MHIPVLLEGVIKYLDPKPNENFIDCTVGEGGHTLAILEKNGPNGKVLGIDRDPDQIVNCKLKIENFKDRVIHVCDNFANLKDIVREYNFGPVNGILLDLGMSSWHLEESGRGFSFRRDEPLIMRYARNEISNFFTRPSFAEAKFRRVRFPISKKELTAEEIVNSWSESDLEKILKEYGEERFARWIARGVIKARAAKPIKTTFQLVDVVKENIPGWYQHGRIHFATRTFQALRIAVNDEVENLKKVLPRAIEILDKGGRIVIMSFHSLEDRVVKNYFKEMLQAGRVEVLTKKPIQPSSGEIKKNPRARSAKLRAAIKM